MKLVQHERAEEGTARDDYETPDFLFDQLNSIFCFNLDVCATRGTSKCDNYLGPESPFFVDALDDNCDWLEFGNVAWCNPPFSLWPKFLEKAARMASSMTIAFLVPPRCGTAAFHKFVPRASEIIILEGRVSFLLDGEPKTKNGADSIVLIFRPRLANAVYGTPTTVFWDWKNIVGYLNNG